MSTAEFLVVAVALVWIVVLLQGAALIELLRQLGQLRVQIRRQGAAVLPDEGLPDRAPIPDLHAVRTLAGSAIQRHLHDSVVLFLTPECVTCREVARGVSDLALETGAPVLVVLHAHRDAAAAFAKEFRLAADRLVADSDGVVASAFNIKTSPSAVVVAKGLKRAHGVVNTIDQASAFYDLTVSRMSAEVPG